MAVQQMIDMPHSRECTLQHFSNSTGNSPNNLPKSFKDAIALTMVNCEYQQLVHNCVRVCIRVGEYRKIKLLNSQAQTRYSLATNCMDWL